MFLNFYFRRTQNVFDRIVETIFFWVRSKALAPGEEETMEMGIISRSRGDGDYISRITGDWDHHLN